MQKQAKSIYQVIEENLSQLYIFSVSMTAGQKKAERLIQTLFAEVDNQHEYLIKGPDLKSRLFRLLYQLYLIYEGQKVNENNDETYEHLEEFYLYNRLEEGLIYDHDEKFALISLIHQTELEYIYANLPVTLRPYMILRDICDFSYDQISYILDVPLNGIAPKLSLGNRIFQSVLWEIIVNKRLQVSL